MTAAELRTAFGRWRAEHGFTSQQTAALGWKYFSAEEAGKLWPRLPSALVRAGFIIPYHDVDGKLNGHRRWRNLDLTLRGFAAVTGHAACPPRYVTELESLPAVYIPRLVPPHFKWRTAASDPSQFLLVTEGEAKAQQATLHGFPTLGLGGVWSFRSKRQGWSLLPDLERWVLPRRKIYVVFDSDSAEKTEVRFAQNVLCQELTLRAARVHAVTIPALPELTKTGLDDFLLYYKERGPDELRRLLNETPEWAESAELARMNTKAIFVNNLAVVHMLDDGTNLSERKFYFRHATLTYPMHAVRNKQPVIVNRPTAAAWVKWPGRASCSRLTFDPTADPLDVTERGEYNLYRGLTATPKEGNVAPWLALRDHLFPEEDARRWFTCWLAYPLQRLAERADPKMHSCAALISDTEGTGKGLIVAPVRNIYGPNARALTPADFRTEFTEWARHLLFAQGNEITGKQSRDFADDLKALITEPEIRIREMFTPAYMLPNHLNLYFTSNHHDAFFLGFKDRRFFVHRTPEVKIVDAWDRARVDAYVEWMALPDAAAALFYYLLHVRLGNWDHRQPPETVAKLEMQEQSANQLDLWARAVKENPELSLKKFQLSKETSTWDNSYAKRKLWIAEELLPFFDPAGKRGFTSRAMGNSLRTTGWYHVLRGRQIRNLRGYGKKPVWALPRYAEEVSQLSERAIAKLFNDERKESGL